MDGQYISDIVLFPAACNFAFKHIGREMMQIVEHTKPLAPV
jgi:hypothetical protein